MELNAEIDWDEVAAICDADEKPHKTIADKRPIKFAVIDSETDPFDGQHFVKPFIWGYYDGKEYIEFAGPYCTENLIEFLSNYKGYIFAHNGGKFDFHFIIHAFDKQKSLTIINGRIARGRLGKATMQDSYCILPTPLSAYKKDEINYNLMLKLNRELPENKLKISEYLQSDCVYLHDYVRQFLEIYGMNITLASAAMKQWKSIGGRIPRSDKGYYEKFYPFYYGGRVEPFQAGIFNGNYNIYDIKSAYPRAMIENHAIGCDWYETRKPNDAIIQNSLLEIECISKGAFPKRTKNGLIFPNNNKHDTYFVTGWEFIKGIETKTIIDTKIKMAYVFEDTTSFKPYVDHFYGLKIKAENEKNNTQRTFAKLFLNSLYGKFAANPDKYEEFYLDNYGAIPMPVNENDYEYCPGPVYGQGENSRQLFSRPLPDGKQKYYNVVTAASITGYVRAYLWESIQKCQNVLYCDTDSIICQNGDKLPIGKELGQWEKEGEANKISIAGKKLYACRLKDGKIKKASKGVNLSADEIELIASGSEIEWKSQVESFSLKTPKKFLSRKIKKTA